MSPYLSKKTRDAVIKSVTRMAAKTRYGKERAAQAGDVPLDFSKELDGWEPAQAPSPTPQPDCESTPEPQPMPMPTSTHWLARNSLEDLLLACDVPPAAIEEMQSLQPRTFLRNPEGNDKPLDLSKAPERWTNPRIAARIARDLWLHTDESGVTLGFHWTNNGWEPLPNWKDRADSLTFDFNNQCDGKGISNRIKADVLGHLRKLGTFRKRAPRHLIGFPNGVLDPVTGDFTEGKPTRSMGITNNRSFPYEPGDTSLWNATLRARMGSEDDVTLLKATIRYLLAPLGENESNPEGKLVILIGPSGTGKSTILHVITALCGGSPYVGAINKRDCSPDRGPIGLLGCNVGIEHEFEGFFKEAEVLKKLITNEPVKVTPMCQNGFTTRMGLKLLVATNSMPRWGGDGAEGMNRRTRILGCPNPLGADEKDPSVERKLLETIPAILKETMEMPLDEALRHLEKPSSAEALAHKEEGIRERYPEAAFFLEVFPEGFLEWRPVAELRMEYLSWALAEGIKKEPSCAEFVKNLLRAFKVGAIERTLTRLKKGGRPVRCIRYHASVGLKSE